MAESETPTAPDTLIGSSFVMANRAFRASGFILILFYILCLIPVGFLEAIVSALESGSAGAKFLSLIFVLAATSLVTGGIIIVTLNRLRHGIAREGRFVERCLHFFSGIFVVYLITAVGTAIGLVMLIIPGMFIYSVLMFAAPALVDRDLGPIAALEYSVALGRGQRFEVFMLLLVSVVLGIVIYLIAYAMGESSSLILILLSIAVFGGLQVYFTMLATAGYLYLAGPTGDDRTERAPPGAGPERL